MRLASQTLPEPTADWLMAQGPDDDSPCFQLFDWWTWAVGSAIPPDRGTLVQS